MTTVAGAVPLAATVLAVKTVVVGLRVAGLYGLVVVSVDYCRLATAA